MREVQRARVPRVHSATSQVPENNLSGIVVLSEVFDLPGRWSRGHADQSNSPPALKWR
jgi:hypothetical protein